MHILCCLLNCFLLIGLPDQKSMLNSDLVEWGADCQVNMSSGKLTVFGVGVIDFVSTYDGN